MYNKITQILAKTTIPVFQGIHWWQHQKPVQVFHKIHKWIPWKWILFMVISYTCILQLKSYIYTDLVLRQEFLVTKEQLTIRRIPEWLKPYTREIVPVGLPYKMSIFSRNLPLVVAQSYLLNPWVKEVMEVKKSYPNVVEAKLVLKKPFAAICIANKYYLSDQEGYRLPGEYLELSGLPIVYSDSDIPEDGTRWDNKINEGLQLVNYAIEKHLDDYLPINIWITSSSQLILKNKLNMEIIWGTHFNPLFPKIEPNKKMTALLEALSSPYIQKNQLQFKKTKTIDIRFGYCIIRD